MQILGSPPGYDPLALAHLYAHGMGSFSCVGLAIYKRENGLSFFAMFLYAARITDPYVCSYVNMDFIFFSAIHACGASWQTITLSYDIACQYFRNLWKRVQSSNFPELLHLDPNRIEVKAAIPKFHLPAHQE